MVFVCDVSNSPLCIGGYSALPSANLFALGVIQARLSSALDEPQLCLWSSNIGVSVGIGVMIITAKIVLNLCICKFVLEALLFLPV